MGSELAAVAAEGTGIEPSELVVPDMVSEHGRASGEAKRRAGLAVEPAVRWLRRGVSFPYLGYRHGILRVRSGLLHRASAPLSVGFPGMMAREVFVAIPRETRCA